MLRESLEPLLEEMRYQSLKDNAITIQKMVSQYLTLSYNDKMLSDIVDSPLT